MRICRLSCAAVAAAALFSPVPALAATSATEAGGKALVLVPLSLTKIQDLDFGSAIPSSVLGSLIINSSTGARSTVGGVTLVPSDSGQRGYFAGAGSPNQQVLLAITAPSQLTSAAGDTINVIGLTLDGSALRTIDSTHAFYVGVGGSLEIQPNQAEGLYTGQFDLYANYQ